MFTACVPLSMVRFAHGERTIHRVKTLLFLLSVVVLVTGCATAPAPVTPSPATSPVGIVVPPGKILVEFQTLDCVCNLGDVEFSLLEIESVSVLDWDIADNRVWLIFVDNRRPTDEEIQRSIQDTPLKIKRIARG